MRYLGGKSKIAKRLAAAIAANTPNRRCWEPFCGGLAMSEALTDVGFDVCATDVCRPLVAMLDAVRKGWAPPHAVSRETWEASKHLPDTDPMKAFCAFGVSFGGGAWQAYAADGKRHCEQYARQTAEALTRQSVKPRQIGCLDFQDIEPEAEEGLLIYCDPPYEGTTGYALAPPFNHEAFWRRCRDWAALGVPVYVSEARTPSVPHEVLWSESHGSRMVRNRKGTDAARTEYLVRVYG